jgi:asparagine synthase (glutamine-hydrolysing)
MDEPAAGPGLFPQYQVSRLARQHVTVVLGGQGGDEIFGGYARYLIAYLEQALKGAILGTQEEGRHIVTLQSIIPNLGVLRTYLPLMQHFWREGLFEDMDARYFRLINRSPDIDRLLTPEAKDHCSTEAVFESFRQVFNHPQTRSYLNKMTHFDLKTLLPALLQVEDRVSMAVSLESRVPLLDYRIVELMGHMPPALKFKGGRTKHILKSALENLLPSEIIHRQDKMGFPVPLREWVRQGPVRDFVREVLLGRACRERGVFSVPALEGMLARESILERQLWGAICLELWFQTFFDASPSQWANTSSNNSIPAS